MFIGIDKREIIRLCQCTDVIQFVHVKCLEKSVNTKNIYHCGICGASLPLIQKNKSPIKVNLERAENRIFKENNRVSLKKKSEKNYFSLVKWIITLQLKA